MKDSLPSIDFSKLKIPPYATHHAYTPLGRGAWWEGFTIRNKARFEPTEHFIQGWTASMIDFSGAPDLEIGYDWRESAISVEEILNGLRKNG